MHGQLYSIIASMHDRSYLYKIKCFNIRSYFNNTACIREQSFRPSGRTISIYVRIYAVLLIYTHIYILEKNFESRKFKNVNSFDENQSWEELGASDHHLLV